jgi:hypothetical protein
MKTSFSVLGECQKPAASALGVAESRLILYTKIQSDATGDKGASEL